MMTLLNRMDRASMYSGLEARVPFADPRILGYVYNIPWEMKCHNGRTKVFCRKPEKVFSRIPSCTARRVPILKTYDPAYERLLAGRLMEMLIRTNSPLSGIVDRRKLEAFLKSPSDTWKPWYGQLMAGPSDALPISLQVGYWMEKYGIS